MIPSVSDHTFSNALVGVYSISYSYHKCRSSSVDIKDSFPPTSFVPFVISHITLKAGTYSNPYFRNSQLRRRFTTHLPFRDRIDRSNFASRQHPHKILAHLHTHPPPTMLILRQTLALAAILISFCTPKPHISIRNHSNQAICYEVEYSNGTGVFPSEYNMSYSKRTGAFPSAVCGTVKGNKTGGFWLQSGQTMDVDATGTDGVPFNGAITPVLNNNSFIGARCEVNFLNASVTYYDMSYSYGITDGTCGPAENTNPAGERYPLLKANKAWATLNQTTKNHLLTFPEYLQQAKNGSLVYINMNVGAWPTYAPEVVYFFQITAGFRGYMGPGSERGVNWNPGTIQNISVEAANAQVRTSPSRQFIIDSY